MRNCNNCAHLEWANGGRHEDSGQPLTQELLNSIMRTPGELACEWTRDALEEIRDMLRAMKGQA